ncbi:uncharacterized protein LOC128870418 [Anastrepha ludens]|uniref:uncharacterized protein LOC128870418 n=1 Tax=Anastrepha ludens TaxID=28586 RepID=UPI0023B16377|nr:uncharacterized protein LOC128870418 [Anastrepha ludens]
MEMPTSHASHGTTSLSEVITHHSITGPSHSLLSSSHHHHQQLEHQATAHTSNTVSALHLHSSSAGTLAATSAHHHSHLAHLQSQHPHENPYVPVIQTDNEKNIGKTF